MRLGILRQVKFCRGITKEMFLLAVQEEGRDFHVWDALCGGGGGDGTDTGDGGGKNRINATESSEDYY